MTKPGAKAINVSRVEIRLESSKDLAHEFGCILQANEFLSAQGFRHEESCQFKVWWEDGTSQLAYLRNGRNVTTWLRGWAMRMLYGQAELKTQNPRLVEHASRLLS